MIIQKFLVKDDDNEISPLNKWSTIRNINSINWTYFPSWVGENREVLSCSKFFFVKYLEKIPTCKNFYFDDWHIWSP